MLIFFDNSKCWYINTGAAASVDMLNDKVAIKARLVNPW